MRIADWLPGSKSPVGELVERLGMAGNNDTEMHAILAEYELPYRFEPEIEEAAEAIDARVTGREIAERRDFRQVTTFTVDPADAKDFDDALSVRRVRDLSLIHISRAWPTTWNRTHWRVTKRWEARWR